MYAGFPAPAHQVPIAERVWGIGTIRRALHEFPRSPVALLHGPDDQQLCVIDRPLRSRQYLVAPVKPAGFEPRHFSGVTEPNGIAVPDDPVRAAAAATRRILPLLRDALAAVRHNAAAQPSPQVARAITLIWYEDGALGTPYRSVPEDAREDLYALGFQYHPHQAAFLLPAAYGEDGHAQRLRALVYQLAHKGIGISLRHPPTAMSRLSVAAPPRTTVATHRR